jgi:hypothetical protein
MGFKEERRTLSYSHVHALLPPTRIDREVVVVAVVVVVTTLVGRRKMRLGF